MSLESVHWRWLSNMTRIRKSPTMTGPFAEVAQEFIQYKRSAGFKYANEPKCLSRFCRFSEEQGVTEIEISRSLAEKWTAPREDESEKSLYILCGQNPMGKRQ